MSHNPYLTAADDLARRLASGTRPDSKIPSLKEAKRLLEVEEERQREEAREYGARRLIAYTEATRRERQSRERKREARGSAEPVSKASRGR